MARLFGACAMLAAAIDPVAAQSLAEPDTMSGAAALDGVFPFPAGGAPALVKALMEPYAHAIASLGFWALVSIALIPLSVVGKPKGRTESGHPVRDYSDAFYRRQRALRNATESTGPFIAATVACILSGAPPFWVNLLASVFIIARYSTSIIHMVSEIQWLRSATWAVGMLCLVGLTGIAIVSAMNL